MVEVLAGSDYKTRILAHSGQFRPIPAYSSTGARCDTRRKGDTVLFRENIHRTGGPAKPGESSSSYLQRSNRPEVIRRCQWVNEWFEEIPLNKRRPFESKLKAQKGDTFIAQFFELTVHRMLCNLDLCVDIEPELQGTENRIDFVVHPPGHEEQTFYVEATVSGFRKGDLQPSENEEDAVEKIRQRIRNPHSELWLETEGALNQKLSSRRVSEPFLELLDRCSPEEVRRIASTGQYWRLPFRKIEVPSTENGGVKWVMKGHLEPRFSPETGRVLGPSRGGAVDASAPLRTSLKVKARKWKSFDFGEAPFIVAVNACSSDFVWNKNDTMDIRRALFADPGNEGHYGEFHHSLRCIDGVVLFDQAVLGNELNSRVRLFRNGNADLPEPLLFLLDEQRLGTVLGIDEQD